MINTLAYFVAASVTKKFYDADVLKERWEIFGFFILSLNAQVQNTFERTGGGKNGAMTFSRTAFSTMVTLRHSVQHFK